MIDICCVAVHCSQRCENAEAFLNTQCKDTATHDRALYLKQQPGHRLIGQFVATCTEPSPQTSMNIT
jgi:hypothetical protein